MSPIVRETGFTFDQQKELLMLKLENDRFKIKAELEKKVTVERLRQETEQLKLEIEQSKIALIREGKIPAVSETGSSVSDTVSMSISSSQLFLIWSPSSSGVPSISPSNDMSFALSSPTPLDCREVGLKLEIRQIFAYSTEDFQLDIRQIEEN
ncbi:hypothetical protein N1851_033069 [Merluccius polli]|uniref:Uncharacterized protein n=1 Tax=Merluccius polli TaxID=89951 RepID=A0AA47M1Y0_MERPO|nr:hypothetical protein N1851_033069 [Merluccius polli]